MAKVIRFYGETLESVLTMPVRTFWSLVKNINALRAEEDLRAINVVLSAQSAEFCKATRDHLISEAVNAVKAKETPPGQMPEDFDFAASKRKLKMMRAGLTFK